MVIPSNGRTSLSTLSMTNTLTTATNTAAVASILDPLNKPTQLKIGVDTEGTGNSQWSVPILMDEYLAGTHDETWYRLGYFTGSATVDSNGYTVAWDAADQRFEYTTGPASFLGRPADYTDATLAANIALLMAPNANAGAGANYREYRALSKSAGRDEVLQVWAFDESYTLQYRNRSGGGEAKQQAWSFGGNATTAMPTSGSGIYSGRFAATAKSENWIQPDGSDINPNALWQVEGATSIAADFGTGDVSGTLTPETWSSYQSGAVGYYTWNNLTSAATAAQPNFTEIYGTVVDISGSIDQTTGAIPTNSANFTGEANLSGYETGDNPVYGGFFGTNAEEVAGVFSAYGIDPQPIGGSAGINDDRNAYLTINGAFHGDCQVASTGCTP